MEALIATMLLSLVPHEPAAGAERFACDMTALTKSERAHHQRLARTLLVAVEERRELSNGYAFRLPPRTLMSAAEWISRERRCCPFFTFELEVPRDAGPLWLRVTGSEGVKAFIRAEFQLDSTP